MTVRVLLVEDDPDFRDGLMIFLCEAGIDVHAIGDVSNLATDLAQYKPHVVVLDINLPGTDGLTAASALRETTDVGIVILTGRTERHDRFHGLSIGVDHYLTKPTDPAELELVIRNLHRRLQMPQASAAEPKDAVWIFHTTHWILTSPMGKQISLSRQEYEVLRRLIIQQGRPVSRAELLQKNEEKVEIIGRNLDLAIFRLRRRVERECGCPLPVLSVRGVGYVFSQKSEIR